mgnify:CR=1 FL=1|jgi:large subunit ribosomal protein L14
MIYKGSVIKVIDNSGGRFVKCIYIYKKSFKSKARIGDLLLVSAKRIIPNKKIKKGVLYKGLVVRLKTNIIKYGGFFVRFNSSALILYNMRDVMIGTRVLSPVSSKLRDFGFFKIISLAPAVV